jgi:hypothetical protein
MDISSTALSLKMTIDGHRELSYDYGHTSISLTIAQQSTASPTTLRFLTSLDFDQSVLVIHVQHKHPSGGCTVT